jgi:hypothetical protein
VGNTAWFGWPGHFYNEHMLKNLPCQALGTVPFQLSPGGDNTYG